MRPVVIKTACVDLDLPLLTWGDNWNAWFADETRPGHYGSGNTEQDAIADLIARHQPVSWDEYEADAAKEAAE